MPLIFGYWQVRGRGAAIRNLLRYVEADYENVTYPLEAPHYSKEQWLKVKFCLSLSFPNLPYLIDGEVKLTQSLAILKYLARKFNLCATSDPELAIEEMALFQINDLSERMRQTTHYKKFNSDEAFQEELKRLRDDLHLHLQLLEAFLIDKKWFTGERLSYVDFLAYEVIDWYRVLIEKDCLEQYNNLNKFMKQFETLEKLQDFIASDEYQKNAIFGPSAKIGNKPNN